MEEGALKLLFQIMAALAGLAAGGFVLGCTAYLGWWLMERLLSFPEHWVKQFKSRQDSAERS